MVHSGTSQGYQGFREQRPLLRAAKRLLLFLLVLFLLYQAVTILIVRTVEQQSVAMQPAINPGDRFILVPMIYGAYLPLFDARLPGFQEPRRGDVVALRPGYVERRGLLATAVDPAVRFVTTQRRSLLGEQDWKSRLQIKRIIGLPGDTVRIERFVAFVRPSGESEFISEFAVTDRQYTLSDGPRPQGWRSTDPFGGATAEITLAPDQYFVLADNRAEGFDSRHWGPVSKSDIYGRLWVRFWPVNRVNAL